jgi:hypothetical protein
MCKAAVRDVLKKGGFYDDEGSKYLFLSLHDAVVFAVHGAQRQQPSERAVDVLDPESNRNITTGDDNNDTSDSPGYAIELTDADVAIAMMNANLDSDDEDDDGDGGHVVRIRRRATGQLTTDGVTTGQSGTTEGGLPYISRVRGTQLELPLFNHENENTN